MTVILYLLGVSLTIAVLALGIFMWSLKSGQYEDLEGAANRILYDDDNPARRLLTAPDAVAAKGAATKRSP
jgi:cbb3-type cytochrome oxidase maturation protein